MRRDLPHAVEAHFVEERQEHVVDERVFQEGFDPLAQPPVDVGIVTEHEAVELVVEADLTLQRLNEVIVDARHVTQVEELPPH